MLEKGDNRSSIKLSFLPYGSVLSPEPGKIAVDVGNRLCPGIIDHHQPGVPEECATSLVVRYPHLILDHLGDMPVAEVTLITHIAPDLDAVTAAFLVHFLLLERRLPAFAHKIADYLRDVDRGICFKYSGKIATPCGLFAGLCELVRQQAEREGLSESDIYVLRMHHGFALWEYVLPRLTEETDLHSSDLFGGAHPFRDALDLVANDYGRYLSDLQRCEKRQFNVPLKTGAGSALIDALLVRDPQSLLFRSWARGDNVHAPQGKGFPLLAVNYRDQRYVISVDPQAPYYLKGLGDMLEKMETQKRREMGLERTGAPRPGYDNPDPWYDGRNPLHNYTIIDTPRAGTVLSWEEIVSALQGYSRQMSS